MLSTLGSNSLCKNFIEVPVIGKVKFDLNNESIRFNTDTNSFRVAKLRISLKNSLSNFVSSLKVVVEDTIDLIPDSLRVLFVKDNVIMVYQHLHGSTKSKVRLNDKTIGIISGEFNLISPISSSVGAVIINNRVIPTFNGNDNLESKYGSNRITGTFRGYFTFTGQGLLSFLKYPSLKTKIEEIDNSFNKLIDNINNFLNTQYKDITIDYTVCVLAIDIPNLFYSLGQHITTVCKHVDSTVIEKIHNIIKNVSIITKKFRMLVDPKKIESFDIEPIFLLNQTLSMLHSLINCELLKCKA
jgi:hypothetical protein